MKVIDSRFARSVATVIGTVALALATQLVGPAAAQEGVELFKVPQGDPSAVCGTLAYVTNSYSNTLSVIDLAENRVIASLPTGIGPVNPTFSHDWTKLYLSNGLQGTLSVVDARTGKLTRTIPAGGDRPAGLRFLPGDQKLAISYLAAEMGGAGALGLMDLTTGKLDWKIPVGLRPERFDITPDGKRAYVANLLGQSVTVVDLERGKVIATIPMPERYPYNVLVSPKGNRVFVGATMGSAIFEIDPATNRVVKTIRTAAGPNGMSFTPDGDNILITAVYAGRLQAYNLSAGVVSDGAFVGFMPGFLRLTRDGTKGILVRPYGRGVSIFDGATLQVTGNIATGIGPSTVAICGNP